MVILIVLDTLLIWPCSVWCYSRGCTPPALIMSSTMASVQRLQRVSLSRSAHQPLSNSLSFRTAVSLSRSNLHSFTTAHSTCAVSRPLFVAVRANATASAATQFGSRSTAAEVTEGISLDGKVFVVTGESR